MTISHRSLLTIGLSLLGCAVLFSGCMVLTNPLRAPPERIRTALLKETPPGTSLEQVQAFIESHYGHNRAQVESKGFLKQEEGQAYVIVGASSVEADLGQYYDILFPFPVFVSAYWAFDAHGRLMDVWVKKTRDGP